MGIMRYDSEVSSDVIKCHQMSPLLLREHKKLLIKSTFLNIDASTCPPSLQYTIHNHNKK